MKKTLFAILAVLFTIMLIATCDLLEEPSVENKVEFPTTTPDGQPMVVVTLNVGNLGISPGRAMSMSDSKLIGVDDMWYEVAFVDPAFPGIYYRTYWKGSESTKIAIPMITYSSPAEAVVFAGTYGTGDKYTLLGVGKITGTDDNDNTSNTTITKDTKTVYFTLSGLKSAVGNTSSSSFTITGLSPADQTGSIVIDGIDLSYYEIPHTGYNGSVTGQFTFKWDGDTDNGEGVYLCEIWEVHSIEPNELSGSMGTATTGTVEISGKAPTTGQLMSTAGSSFTFNIKPPSSVGTDVFSKIYIEVPVTPIGTGGIEFYPGSALTWFIRSGIENEKLDGTVSSVSSIRGGAVLLLSKDNYLSEGLNFTSKD